MHVHLAADARVKYPDACSWMPRMPAHRGIGPLHKFGRDLRTVINQMQIHGVVGADGIVGGDGLGDGPVGFHGLLFQDVSGHLYEQRDGTVDDGDQPGYHQIFTAHGDGRMKFNVFMRMVGSGGKQLLDFEAQAANPKDVFGGGIGGRHTGDGWLQEKAHFQKIRYQLFLILR